MVRSQRLHGELLDLMVRSLIFHGELPEMALGFWLCTFLPSTLQPPRPTAFLSFTHLGTALRS